jgi:hypothetical protein
MLSNLVTAVVVLLAVAWVGMKLYPNHHKATPATAHRAHRVHHAHRPPPLKYYSSLGLIEPIQEMLWTDAPAYSGNGLGASDPGPATCREERPWVYACSTAGNSGKFYHSIIDCHFNEILNSNLYDNPSNRSWELFSLPDGVTPATPNEHPHGCWGRSMTEAELVAAGI